MHKYSIVAAVDTVIQFLVIGIDEVLKSDRIVCWWYLLQSAY